MAIRTGADRNVEPREPTAIMMRGHDHRTGFAPSKNGHLVFRVDDIEQARADLEAKGVEFLGETFDTSVCHTAFFDDPDGTDLMVHSRYAT